MTSGVAAFWGACAVAGMGLATMFAFVNRAALTSGIVSIIWWAAVILMAFLEIGWITLVVITWKEATDE